MDHPAALYRLKVGVPATVEHASDEGGAETAQAVAETTQVCSISRSSLLPKLTTVAEFHHLHGRSQAAATS